MNITIMRGLERKGSTYNTAKLFTEALASGQDPIAEFFMPRDISSFCVGCC